MVGIVQSNRETNPYRTKEKQTSENTTKTSFAEFAKQVWEGTEKTSENTTKTSFAEFAKQVWEETEKATENTAKTSFADLVKQLENEARKTAKNEKDTDAREFLKKKMDELYKQFKKGETKPSYQIGAVSFTEQEWDKLLEKFDSLQEAIRACMREEQERRTQEQERTEQRIEEQNAKLLTGEFTSCTYPAGKENAEDTRYITCYTPDGIVCRKAGGEELWSINFENKQQYEKVMQLIKQFPQNWNMRFASNESFWKDFLDDKIDMEQFMKFLSETDNGVPDYSVKMGDSLYIDKEKAVWAKYMNEEGSKFYTAQEMQQMMDELIAKNTEKMIKLEEI